MYRVISTNESIVHRTYYCWVFRKRWILSTFPCAVVVIAKDFILVLVETGYSSYPVQFVFIFNTLWSNSLMTNITS